jgi:Ca2+-transporting ATPase
MVFFTLASFQMFYVLSVRWSGNRCSQLGLNTNWYLTRAVTLTFALQIAVTYVPFLQPIFQHRDAAGRSSEPSASRWSGTALLFSEIQKYIIRRRDSAKPRRRGGHSRPSGPAVVL